MAVGGEPWHTCAHGPWAKTSRREGLHPRGPAALPAEGARVPRRVRADAARVALRLRAAADRARDRAQPGRRRTATRRCATPRCSRRSPTRTSRPSWASSTSRSTCRPGLLAGDGAGRARGERAGQPQRRRGARRGRVGRAHGDDRHPADARPRTHLNADELQRQPALRAAQRADLRRPRRGPAHRDRRRRAAARPPPTRSRPRRPAPASSSTCRSTPRTFAGVLERGAGDRRRAGRARRELAVPLRQGAVARDPDRRCSSRPPTPARRSCKAQGVRPRVWFGERWITSIFDLFEENVRYFPALLPICDDEDPVEVLRRAATSPRWASCGCTTAPSTAGTGPSTTSSRGRPHLRVENRVLPAGPTVVDIAGQRAPSTTGWCARWPRTTGRSGRRCRSRPPRRTSTPAPGDGIDAACLLAGRWARCRPPSWCCAGCCRWPHEGLDRWGVDPGDRDRLLGIIEQRCLTGRNGAAWQAATFHRLYEEPAARPPRRAARDDRCATSSTCTRNEPVHTWPLPEPLGGRGRAPRGAGADRLGQPVARPRRGRRARDRGLRGRLGPRRRPGGRGAGGHARAAERAWPRARGSGGGRTLLLCGHTDTVTVAGMSDPPHRPRVEGERLFGRGAYDMKAGVAAALVACRDSAGLGLAGDVVVAAVADEEHASLGVREVAGLGERRRGDRDRAHRAGSSWSRTRGSSGRQAEVSGRAAHGSRPHLGVDAIVKSGPVLTRHR